MLLLVFQPFLDTWKNANFMAHKKLLFRFASVNFMSFEQILWSTFFIWPNMKRSTFDVLQILGIPRIHYALKNVYN